MREVWTPANAFPCEECFCSSQVHEGMGVRRSQGWFQDEPLSIAQLNMSCFSAVGYRIVSYLSQVLFHSFVEYNYVTSHKAVNYATELSLLLCQV